MHPKSRVPSEVTWPVTASLLLIQTIEEGVSVSCGKCKEFLANETHVFLYDQYANGTHFCIKAELSSTLIEVDPSCKYFDNVNHIEDEHMADVESLPQKMEVDADGNDDEMPDRKRMKMRPQPTAKRAAFAPHIFVCANCNATLGNICPIGPKKDFVCCFTRLAIRITMASGLVLGGGKWETVRPFLGSSIEIRDIITFYEIKNEHIGSFSAPPSVILRPTHELIRQTPLRELTADRPRDYQIECFVQAALQNLIVYLPTGAGKTLVASMLIGLLHRLNPFKTALFIVHRVSLAFQQAQYIKEQTGLNVLVACGETVEDMSSKIRLNEQPVIVVTAQVLINWIKRQQLRLEDCSMIIIDEVHNAVKGHPFVFVLKEFYSKIDPVYRPLFLGLTASPTSGDMIKMHLTLQRLCEVCDSKIYMPTVYWDNLMESINRPIVTFSVVSVTDEMKLMNGSIVCYCSYLMTRVKDLTGIDSFLMFPGIDSLQTARGFIRALSDRVHQGGNSTAIQLMFLVSQVFSAVEINSVIGPRYARLYLSEILNAAIHKKDSILSEECQEITGAFLAHIRPLDTTSDKVQVLMDILMSIPEAEARKARVIIFVETKRTARQLFQILKEDEGLASIWLPAILVGNAQGQVDGMSYLDDQAPTLSRFHLGQHRLLISTNVLQEGMDVPVCNRVILFDQSWSLTSFIQSRGRARASDSIYDLICSQQEKEKYEVLIKMETSMENTIIRSMSMERVLNLKTIGTLLYMKHETDKITSWFSRRSARINSLGDDGRELTGSAAVKPRRIRFVILRFFNLPDLVEPTMIEEALSHLPLTVAKIGKDSTELFTNSTVHHLVGEVYSTVPFGLADFYKLARDAIKACSEQFVCLMSYALPGIPAPPCNHLYLIVADSMDVGNLLTPSQFVAAQSITAPVKFGVNFTQGVIRAFFSTTDHNCCYRLDIPMSSIDKFVVVDIDDASRVSVVIPLNRSPLLFYTHTEDMVNVKLSNLDILAWERSCLAEFTPFIDVTDAAAIKFDIFVRGLDRVEFLNVAHRLKGQAGIEEVFFGPVETVSGQEHLGEALLTESSNYFSEDFDLVYTLRAFFGSCYFATCCRVRPRFFDILNMLPPATRTAQIAQMALRCTESRFVDLELGMLEIIQEQAWAHVSRAQPSNTCPLRFVTVTPSKIIYELPKDMMLNRILRSYNPEYFIRVQFRDEDRMKLSTVKSSASLKNLLLRVERVLQDGIYIGGRHYEFLAMSSSQLRDHGCWFVAPHYDTEGQVVNAQSIRAWSGNYSKIKNVAKYVARLGQSLSASQDTVVVPSYDFEMVPDIKVVTFRPETEDEKEYIFTDGIGMISPALAREINEKLELVPCPSAFQIRFAGFKGVVAVNPNIRPDDPLKKMWLRKSMEKFASQHRVLEVLNTTQIIPCFLNRQVLMILSGLGVPDDSFIHLQDVMFCRMAAMLTDRKEALTFLSQNYDVLQQLPFLQLDGKINAVVEPFFRSLIYAAYKRQLAELLTRSRIFVPKGRILMGTIDETGTLKEGQVFVQCQQVPTDIDLAADGHIIDAGTGMFTLLGEVTIAKNPCMHPGDVRKLEAVDVSALRRTHYDCIVFPAVGPRPITDICSGSDLDGDLYFCTWDRSLLPSTTVSPMEYDAPKATEVDDVTTSHITKFMVDFIANDQLGTIANAHVAHVDYQPEGVRSELCVLLAYIFSMAVDFPKTGFIPEFPKQAQVEHWPDFMQKVGQASYSSPKVIGKLFRKTKSIFFSTSLSSQTNIQVNPALLVPGYEAHLEGATKSYREYSDALAVILGAYSIQEEAQIFAGALTEAGYLKKDDLRTATDVVKRKVKTLQAGFRTAVESHDPVEQAQFASAWYFVAYSKPYRPSGLMTPVLSFPWILGPTLLANCKEEDKDMAQFKEQASIQFAVGKDCLVQAEELLGDDHVSLFMERHQFRVLLESNIKARLRVDGKSVEFLHVGSSVTGVFSRSSDCNLLASLPESVSFTQDLYPAVAEMFHVSLLNDQIVYKGKPCSFVIGHDSSGSQLDQAMFIRSCLTAHPQLFPLLLVIQRWARAQNIVRRSSYHSGVVSSTQLSILALRYFLENLGLESPLPMTMEMNSEQEYNWISSLTSSLPALLDDSALVFKIGESFLAFVRFMAFTSEPEIADLFQRSLCRETTLDGDLIASLREHFFKAIHLLSQTLTVSFLWNTIVSSEVEQEINIARRPNLFRRPGPTSAVFMEGSSVLLFEAAESDLDRVGFELYQLRRRYQHAQAQCFLPLLQDRDHLTGLGSSGKTYSDYFAHAIRQFDLARRHGSSELGVLKMSIKFGNLYVTHLPKMFLEEGMSANIENTRRALMLGYKSITPELSRKLLVDSRASFQLGHPKEDEPTTTESVDKKAIPTPASIIKKAEDGVGPEPKSLKGVAKKKQNLAPMTGSFEPHVHSDSGIRQFIADLAMRPEETLSGYVASLSLFNAAADTNTDFQVMYDSSMNFVRLCDQPIRWMVIDLKSQDAEKQDLRLSLTSRRKIDGLDEDDDMIKLIMSGIVQFIEEKEVTEQISQRGNILKVRPEFLANERLFIRSSHQDRFIPTATTIDRLLAQCPALASVSRNLLQSLVLRISWVAEFFEHDPATGRYPLGPIEKIEVEVDFRLDWAEMLQPGRVQECVQILYHLGYLLKPHAQLN